MTVTTQLWGDGTTDVARRSLMKIRIAAHSLICVIGSYPKQFSAEGKLQGVKPSDLGRFLLCSRPAFTNSFGSDANSMSGTPGDGNLIASE